MAIAIFSGIALFSIIFLYTKTADRWNWKKIWKVSGLSLVSIILIPLILWALVYGYESFNRYLDEKPKKVTSMNGVTLGESLSDIKFKLDIELSESFSKGWESLVYLSKDKRVLFQFSEDKKLIRTGELCVYEQGRLISGPVLNGISCSSSGEDILSKYRVGEIKIKCGRDPKNTSRVYDAINYNIRYTLTGNQVESIAIISPDQFLVVATKNWIPCEELDK